MRKRRSRKRRTTGVAGVKPGTYGEWTDGETTLEGTTDDDKKLRRSPSLFLPYKRKPIFSFLAPGRRRLQNLYSRDRLSMLSHKALRRIVLDPPTQDTRR